MKIQNGQTVVLTGASGGLGVFMARALAELGVNLVLVAYPGAELEAVRRETERLGTRVVTFALDLRDAEQRRSVIEQAKARFGRIDILVNNAGVEFTSPYHELTEANITDIIGVNLEAAMILARLAIPDMLQRKSGHIVNISSLAGKAGPAFQEAYAATKAGLVSFTFSLRASYRREGISASVIVPGFVEAGIYAKLKERSGCAAPALLGTSPPQAVSAAVVRAIERDLPEVIVNPLPVRPLLALINLFPRVGEWATAKTGGHEFFRRVVEAQKNQKS